MANNKRKVEGNDVEVLDFEEEPPRKKISKNKNKKNNIISIISIIIGIIVVISGIFATKTMVDNKKKKEEQQEQVKEEQQTKSNINVNDELNKLTDINNYTYATNINIYTKDDINSIYKINNLFTYNENKYKFDKIQTLQNIEYKSTNYYVKTDTEYFEYINDLTSDTYIRNNIDEANFNSRNIFNNFIKYLVDNNEVSNEKILTIADKEIINITLNTNKDILNTLAIGDNNLNIDNTKLSMKNIKVELYFTKNDKKLYEINFKIEDKNANQADIGTEVEYSTVSYKFDMFNTSEEVILPY